MVKEAVVRDHQETAGLHSGAKEQENRVHVLHVSTWLHIVWQYQH